MLFCSLDSWILILIWSVNGESQATTGMWVSDECKNSFMEMKWKKVHKYIVFKIDEGSRLVTVDKVGGPAESYDDLTASLPNDDCRYAVFDFDFITVDNCRKSKMFFISWYVARFSFLFFVDRIRIPCFIYLTNLCFTRIIQFSPTLITWILQDTLLFERELR